MKPSHINEPIETFAANFLDTDVFEREIIGAYQNGTAERDLPADIGVAVSWVPAASGRLRDFSNIARDIPELDAAKCVGCMECVTQCPDTAIIAKVESPLDLLSTPRSETKKRKKPT